MRQTLKVGVTFLVVVALATSGLALATQTTDQGDEAAADRPRTTGSSTSSPR